MSSDQAGKLMTNFQKALLMSSQIVAVTIVAGIIYGLVAKGRFTFDHAWSAGFVVGAIIIVAGAVMFIMPLSTLFKKSRLLDHTTYREKIDEERSVKNKKVKWLLIVGIFTIIITGAIQLLVWLIT